MADTNANIINTDILNADQVTANDVNAGNVIVTGSARFINPIHANIEGSKDINTVNTGTITNSTYVILSNGNSLFRMSYDDLVADLSSRVTVDIPDSEGVGY